MVEEKVCVFHRDLKEQVQDHERRIDTLEKDEIRNDERISTLCDRLDHLTSWIEKLVVAIAATLITGGASFVIWYIQSLPR